MRRGETQLRGLCSVCGTPYGVSRNTGFVRRHRIAKTLGRSRYRAFCDGSLKAPARPAVEPVL